MGVITFNPGASSDLIENELQYQKMKKELDELQAKFTELVQKLRTVLNELVAMTASKTPLSSEDLAKIMGKVDSILDECNQTAAQEKLIEAELGYSAIHTLAQNPLPSQDVALLQGLLHQLQNAQKELALNDEKEESQKALKQMLHRIIQNIASKNSETPSQLQKLAELLNQFTILMSGNRTSSTSQSHCNRETNHTGYN